jgi:hypothetical protein
LSKKKKEEKKNVSNTNISDEPKEIREVINKIDKESSKGEISDLKNKDNNNYKCKFHNI